MEVMYGSPYRYSVSYTHLDVYKRQVHHLVGDKNKVVYFFNYIYVILNKAHNEMM